MPDQPAKLGPLPLIVGITGHRDLRPEDLPRLEAELNKVFSVLRTDHPHTPLVAISSLAEGADRLGARVALENGASLVVPLPLPRPEYMKDFTTGESRAEFAGLLARARNVIELPTLPTPPRPPSDSLGTPADGRARQYALAGAFIARHSQILVALWDGVENTKIGGTRQIVRFKLEGVPEPFGPAQSPLDPVESGPVYQIVTPRQSLPTPAGPPCTLRRLYPESHEAEHTAAAAYARVYRRMEVFNHDALRLGLGTEEAVRTNLDYVMPPVERAKLTPAERELFAHYGAADMLAIHFRDATHVTLRLLLVLVSVATFLFTFSDAMLDPLPLRLAYLAVLLFGFLVYRLGRRGQFEDKYLDYRALAEGMRVQLFWRLAGIEASVADHYLRIQRSELDWIRHAIRAWSMWDVGPNRGAAESERLGLVLKHWVRDQQVFFTNRGVKDFRRQRWLERLAGAFFCLGFLWAVAKALVGSPHPLIDEQQASFGQPWTWLLHAGVMAIGLAPVLAALIYSFVKTSALSEHVKQYGRMQVLFANGTRAITALMGAGRIPAAQQLVLDLGKEALTENATWVLIHRERPLPAPAL